MGVAVHIGQDGVYPMNAVRVAADGASTIEHHYGYAESSFVTQNIQNLPPGYNYSNEPDRFLETGRVWLQADVGKLHGEVIDSLLDSMHKTGFIMVPTFGIYEANRDVERAMTLPWHATYTLPVGDGFVFSESGAPRFVFLRVDLEQGSGLGAGVPDMDGVCERLQESRRGGGGRVGHGIFV